MFKDLVDSFKDTLKLFTPVSHNHPDKTASAPFSSEIKSCDTNTDIQDIKDSPLSFINSSSSGAKDKKDECGLETSPEQNAAVTKTASAYKEQTFDIVQKACIRYSKTSGKKELLNFKSPYRYEVVKTKINDLSKLPKIILLCDKRITVSRDYYIHAVTPVFESLKHSLYNFKTRAMRHDNGYDELCALFSQMLLLSFNNSYLYSDFKKEDVISSICFIACAYAMGNISCNAQTAAEDNDGQNLSGKTCDTYDPFFEKLDDFILRKRASALITTCSDTKRVSEIYGTGAYLVHNDAKICLMSVPSDLRHRLLNYKSTDVLYIILEHALNLIHNAPCVSTAYCLERIRPKKTDGTYPKDEWYLNNSYFKSFVQGTLKYNDDDLLGLDINANNRNLQGADFRYDATVYTALRALKNSYKQAIEAKQQYDSLLLNIDSLKAGFENKTQCTEDIRISEDVLKNNEDVSSDTLDNLSLKKAKAETLDDIYAINEEIMEDDKCACNMQSASLSGEISSDSIESSFVMKSDEDSFEKLIYDYLKDLNLNQSFNVLWEKDEVAAECMKGFFFVINLASSPLKEELENSLSEEMVKVLDLTVSFIKDAKNLLNEDPYADVNSILSFNLPLAVEKLKVFTHSFKDLSLVFAAARHSSLNTECCPSKIKGKFTRALKLCTAICGKAMDKVQKEKTEDFFSR